VTWRPRRLALAAVAGGWLIAGLVGGVGGPAAASAATPALDRVEHIVVLINGGRTFDSVLGRYPGVDGIADEPRPDMAAFQPALVSDSRAAAVAWAGGAMSGFAVAQTSVGLSGEAPFAVAQRELAPATWELGGQGVIGQRAFASQLDGGVPGRRALFGYPVAEPAADLSGPLPPLAGGSILDALDARAVAWGVYVAGVDPDAGLPAGVAGERITAMVPPLGDPTIVDAPERDARIQSMEAFHLAAIEGDLPAVSYVVSTAPDADLPAADALTAEVANAIARSPAWSSTVLVVTWDAWGGYADHVAPPELADRQLGFRVPLVVGGPLVAAGIIDSTERSQESVLRLIEDRFGIAPRTPVEAASASLADLVTEDGSRPPHLLRDDVVRYLPGVPYRGAVLATYLAFIGLAVGLVVVAWLVDRRNRRGKGGEES
jgi:phospholipase C